MQRDIIDFDDDTVDFMIDVVAVLAPVGDAVQRAGHVVHPGGVLGDGQAPGPQRQIGVVQGGRPETLDVAQAVADHPKLAAGGDGGILLPQ